MVNKLTPLDLKFYNRCRATKFFAGSLILQIGDFFVFLRDPILAIKRYCFFL